MFDQMPPEEKERLLLSIVPERYIKAEVKDFAPAMQKKLLLENDTGFLLWGAAGVGKTHAMAALAKKYIPEGWNVRRVHYELLCLQLRDTFNPRAVQTEWSIIEPLLNCDKLFIEDVGTTRSIGAIETDFSRRTFLVLLDMRLEHCRQTFITSNKSPENLGDSFDERVGDRLRTFQVLRLTGKSKRREIQ